MRCPYCGRIIKTDGNHEKDPGEMVESLKTWCREHSKPVFPGDRVNEETAAALLGRCPGTLKNWRTQHCPVPFVRSGAGRGRISYRLKDIAEHLEKQEYIM
jgi:hypothetical protein